MLVAGSGLTNQRLAGGGFLLIAECIFRFLDFSVFLKVLLMKRLLFLSLFLLLVAATAIATWQNSAPDRHEQSRATPEAGSGFEAREEVRAREYMIATANEHASEAALEMMKAGGNAVDAVIAAQVMLTLVEPQSSGIGGGAFLLHFDAENAKLTSYDGREVAPSAADEKLFLNQDGTRAGFRSAVRSGRSIGVPGVIAMLARLHKTHGSLAWEALFQPTIRLARSGFPVSPRLHKMLSLRGAGFFNQPAQSLFYDETLAARPVGFLLKNPPLADSLEVIAGKGAAGFYEGAIAADIVKAAQEAPTVPSLMTMEDLKGYKAVLRDPVCGPYRGFQICGMGPPSSGGLTVAMTLGLLAPFDLGKTPNKDALHLIVEAEKLAYADRNRYMADPDFVRQPDRFLDGGYLDERRRFIKKMDVMKKAEPGQPFVDEKAVRGRDATIELGGTSHLSIIDKAGNVVSMTSSIEGAFGSGQMVGGFLLNNQLTDFSFLPVDGKGNPIANRAGPLKRPRSSMSPTIVFNGDGTPRAVVGSPGGSRIILFVVKALVAHIDWGMGPQEAVALFNFGSRNGPIEMEVRPESQGFISELEAMGHKVRRAVMTSGAQMITLQPPYLKGGADPRREGVVLGE